MKGARLEYSLGDRAYAVVHRDDVSLWCIEVYGGWYQLGKDPDIAARFLLERVRTAGGESPALIASKRFPLILSIDNTIVRAWPAMIPRNRPGWSKTYLHPVTGIRVGATEGPAWHFESLGKARGVLGGASAEQTIADVVDLARIWLRG